MKIHIPSPLRSYTKNESIVESNGSSVRELLQNLDHAYPGIRFRMIDEQDGIRQHIRIFVERNQVTDLSMPLKGNELVHIICALSGG
jgi:molybdopterin converting factor small subunit